MTANRQTEVVEATKDVDFEANKYQIELNTTHGRILLNLLPDV
ncbi:MAG: peptidylprolyl isomerase, partial [Fuerstiella sp.]|nr:peptidylprolyl isomerase [Fuerstiella sp.]